MLQIPSRDTPTAVWQEHGAHRWPAFSPPNGVEPTLMHRATAWLASRDARNLALAALMILLLARVPFAGAHMGLARDFFTAYRIVHGDEFPLYGPVLNETIHLGPIWFYLFALLLAIGRSWLITLLLLGTIAALQIPLAYLLGKALHSRRAGLLFAVGLLVPNWATFEWLLPSHPLLSAPLDLALLLCAVRYCKRPRTRYFIGMAIFYVLSIHAHPANAGLGWVVIGVTAWAWHRGVLRVFDVAVGVALAAVPLVPFLAWDAAHGFAELRHAGVYLGNAQATGSPFDALRLLGGVAYGGIRDWFEPTIGWPVRSADLAAWLVAAGGAAGGIGLLFALRAAHLRRPIAYALLALLGVLLTTAAIRAATPYYMASSTWLMLAGLVGIGLAELGDAVLPSVARVSVVIVALTACMLTIQGSANFQMRGAWPFAWMPLFDIKSARDVNVQTFALMPAYAQAASGRFLCSQSALSLHGAYAAQLVSDHAIAMRLACDRGDVQIGGGAPDRTHWIGLSRALFAAIDVDPLRRVGPIGLLPAYPIGEAAAMLPPDQPIYPAQVPAPPPDVMHRLVFRLGAMQHLAISNLAFGFAAAPEATLRIDDRIIAAQAKDAITTIYACAACVAGSTVDATLEIRGGNYQVIDIVTF